MIAELEHILTANGIKFNRDGNRFRCFPHIVNITVRHGLKALTTISVSTSPDSYTPAPPAAVGLRDARSTQPVAHELERTEEDKEEAILLQHLASTDSAFEAMEAAWNEGLQANPDYVQTLTSDQMCTAACRRMPNFLRTP
ncbi:hypothetical protein LXA43DRAFT_1101982 [Ganoderma leucocontextum]|nr:hypothetical protein LXA43DRAFT_1101982 [Ganoderma leucocontextum]